MSLNPPRADVRTSDLDALQFQNRLTAERIRQARLARVHAAERRRTELLEAYQPQSWFPAYADYLDRLTHREPVYSPATARWQRRIGQNYPIFQSEQELALLRAPSRLLAASNSYAIGLCEGLTSYVIGTGYTYRVAARQKRAVLPDGLVESCQFVIDDFLDRNEWHGGEQPSLEEELFQRSIVDGDALLVSFRQADGTVELRTVEPDQLTIPPDGDPRDYSFGVHTEPRDPQKPLAYWLQFGDTPSDGEEFTPDEVLHIKRNAPRGVKRGWPDFCFDTGDALRLAGILRENLVEGAAIQAAIVGVRQHESGTQTEIQAFVDDESEWSEIVPSTGGTRPARRAAVGMEDVPKGLNYVPGPGSTNTPAHVSVLETCLRGCGVRWNAPEWLATGTGSAINYASSLTTESPFVRTVLRRQRAYRECFRRTIVNALRWTAECGRIIDAVGRVWRWAELTRLVDVLAEAPSPETRNLLEDAQRSAIEIPLGLDSREQYIQRHGGDVDQIASDNREWLADHGSAGQELELPTPGLDDAG